MDLKALIDEGTVKIEEVDPTKPNTRRLAVHVTHNGATRTRYVNWPLVLSDYRGDLVRVAPMLMDMVRRNVGLLPDEDQRSAKRILVEFADPDRKVNPAAAIRTCIEHRVKDAMLECNESHDQNLCLDCPDTGVKNELRITDSRTKEVKDEPNP